ncbi:LGFP repeat-containing protein [Cryobacterium psychrotolerans]|uniref:LGFP repeat-containing protein n=1 Tax=Cryobacterium psychrotolerans TaxID=386301 RepID=A0A1G9CK63_9MICO|nr:hypothetical protein [Cryobacterium psychrotolerans]TFD84258.1 hypothetical protein E3T56_11235 [Cryobacterium psychrotolerans]SDK51966.1 LGFP repeat-containing protein [Cryobacterium psychrotolerans]
MRTTLRRVAAKSIGLVVAVSLLVSIGLVATPAQPAEAANGADFNPGMIISDAIFYNGRTMTAAQVQTFLNGKVPTCRSGYTCLKSYRESTTSQSAKSEGCAAYAGQLNETAASIIAKVGMACGINPKALLVLLEKEQGLVTGTHPTASIYRKATGFGCPDTSVCDSLYYGFFNQVYQAAYMFKKYQARPASRGYVAGRYNTILWNPNSACGSSSVYIQNQATAGLYIYTPYRPNAAALANMYGTGNSCSAYGNRNFWRLFTDWFGSTTGGYATSSSLASLDSTTIGLLGTATSQPITYPDGGIGQAFQYGWAYWHSATGAFRTTANVGRSYIALKGPNGILGYPTTNPKTEPGSGASQAFQKGWLYYSPTTSIHLVSGPVGRSYATLDGPAGVLGFPIAAAKVEPGGGASQNFQKGALYWSPTTSIHRLSGAIATAYSSLGGPAGVLGYPLAAQVVDSSGTSSQLFQKGTLYSSPTLGTKYVLTALGGEYAKLGGAAGTYGPPAENTTTYPDGGQGQRFQKGWLYLSTATGLDATIGKIGETYAKSGGPVGPLGYPVAPQKTEPNDGFSQAFQKGTLYWSPTQGGYYLLATMADQYLTVGGVAGKYGHPISNTTVYLDGGQGQRFLNGSLFWSAGTGLDATVGLIDNSYRALGGPGGRLGYPLAAQKNEPGSGLSQAFQKGTLYWSPTRGIHYVLKPMADEYLTVGGVGGTFGHPISSTTVYKDGGSGQRFVGGWLYYGEATGLDAVVGKIGYSYAALGGPGGRLGYPLAAQKSEPGSGLSQAFEKGTLYWSPTRGIHYVLKPMADQYLKVGGVGGRWGHPTSSTTVYPDGGNGQAFVGGWLYYGAATGLDAVVGRIGYSYAALGGPGGRLGYPLAAQKAEPGNGLSQTFQKGTLYWSPTRGIHYVLKPMADQYLTVGGVGGKFGHPISSTTVYKDGGNGQRFVGGWLYYGAASGLDAVTGIVGASYSALGGPSGVLGYPAAAGKVDAKGGTSQEFANGWLVWSSATSIDRVAREIGEYYYSNGGPAGKLGYPLESTRVVSPGVLEQAFQGGRVRWTTAGGAVTF